MKFILRVFLITYFCSLPTSAEANWRGVYKSKFEAEKYCSEWVQNGGKFTLHWITKNLDGTDYLVTEDIEIRKCDPENETKQFLGFEIKKYKKNKIYFYKNEPNFYQRLIDPAQWKLKKYFKY